MWIYYMLEQKVSFYLFWWHLPKKNIFGVFDTIISSLQVNSKNLQNLINNLEHQFSVIAVSDTWTSEGKKTKPSIWLTRGLPALLWGKREDFEKWIQILC